MASGTTDRPILSLNINLWIPSERDLGPGLLLLLLAFIPLWYWWWRRLVSRLFAGREGDATALQEIREKLETVNEECPTHLFGAERVATVNLDENPISLAYGFVVRQFWKGGAERHVFAVADQTQADGMRRYSDIFELAFAGSQWSIFWVKIPALLRLLKRER